MKWILKIEITIWHTNPKLKRYHGIVLVYTNVVVFNFVKIYMSEKSPFLAKITMKCIKKKNTNHSQ